MDFTITRGGNTAKISSHGAEMTSFVCGGNEYVWCGNAEFWTGHAPVLFPFVSSLKNGKTVIDGKTYYADKKHGFARNSEFSFVTSSENSATFVLTDSDSTRESYPYKFELYVTHTLTDDGFETAYRVKNPQKSDIQFGIGGHPAFVLGAPLDECRLEFPIAEDCPLYAVDENGEFSEEYVQPRAFSGTSFDLDYNDFDVDALISTGLKSRKVRFVRKDGARGIEFGFGDFPVLLVWTPPKKRAPFMCLEPWFGMPPAKTENGSFSDRAHIITLAAGGEFDCKYTVKVL